MRIRILVLATAVLLFGAVMMVPRIIEASKSSAATAISANPVQGRRPEVTVGESIRNDTSPPVREMKQLPVFKPRKEQTRTRKFRTFTKTLPTAGYKRRSLATRLLPLTCLRPIRTSTASSFPVSRATALRRIRTVKSEPLSTSRWSTKVFRSSTRLPALRCLDHRASPRSGRALVAFVNSTVAAIQW